MFESVQMCECVSVCVAKDDGGEGHSVGACLTCGLVGWLDGWFAV